jgi:hypothetical protein
MLISGLETSNVEAGELENIKSQRLARAGRLFRYSQQISEMGGLTALQTHKLVALAHRSTSRQLTQQFKEIGTSHDNGPNVLFPRLGEGSASYSFFSSPFLITAY